MAKGGKSTGGGDVFMEDRIYVLRGHNIMLDRDVAELYSVDCRAVRDAVLTNRSKFPEDCFFEMMPHELDKLKHGGPDSWQAGLHRPPFCFTWKGIISLSFVLQSDIAVKFSVHVIRKLVEMLQRIRDGKGEVQLVEELKNDPKLMMLLNWWKW